MGRIYIIIAFMGVGLAGWSQHKPNYKFFCPNNDLKPIGYFVGAGFTSSFASTDNELFDMEVSQTTGYQVTRSAAGRAGIHAEIGSQYITENGLFRILEVAVGYRKFKGLETLRASRNPESDLSYPDDIFAEGSFSYSRLNLRFNAQTVTLLGPKSYFHQGPGISVDWSLGLKQVYKVPHLAVNTRAPEQGIIPSINYMAGIGFKVGKGRVLDFYAQIPLIMLEGERDGARELIYSSKYRTYIVGVKYTWLNKTPDRECPALNRPTSGRFSRSRSGSANKPW